MDGLPLRFRGRIGQITEGEPECIGKYAYEVSLWDQEGKNTIPPAKVFGPYESELEAGREGKKIIDAMVKQAQELFGAIPTGEYFDMMDDGKLKRMEDYDA